MPEFASNRPPEARHRHQPWRRRGSRLIHNPLPPSIKTLLAALAGAFLGVHAGADPLADRLEKLEPDLLRQFSVPLEHWRFHQPDVAGGEQTNLDDTTWRDIAPGFSWSGENTKVWFRATVTIPPTVNGQSVEGQPVRLDLGMDDDGELYVDGRLKEAFHWDEGRYTLAEQARPGQTFHLAVRGINGPGDGQLHFARLYFDELPEFDQYLEEVRLVNLLLNRVPADEQTVLKEALSASEKAIHFTGVTATNLAVVRAELAQARAGLAPVAAVTRKYDVYYIGHAHIDMNWLWPWSETIDVCQRTWNSAMNLMDEFPEFKFVQSQPGAYGPVEAGFPREFARMQAMAAKGQWDPVGGLWNESDTDLPSGEGLARSFLLGQNYFKTKFGKYAVTGWLPDSFGHTWQLPQIMRLAGLRYFYHTRCGNDMPFVWWESPDGSRVLKANTPNYDVNVELGQLAEPADNQARFNLPQSLDVFGVGDHGGGPTREHILRLKSYQNDPLLPHVHFAGADDFFDQLARQPAAAELPVVATDLQYTFVGCYTTHADLKKDLRRSENNLYSAEVLSSLAAMMGRPYPAGAFKDAWKPTAFAQFHDIACGTAVHATYDWMHEQLAPAFRFEKEQTDRSLNFLTASADTRGPGTQAIVVWNTLAFARDDVVRVSLADAEKYHSVVDQQGRHLAAQAVDAGTLAFVARAVPAFGYATYFADTNAAPTDGVMLQETGDACDIQTPGLSVQINKHTGAMTKLYAKSAKWDVFGDASDGDALQLLGDSGNAWDVTYTGENKIVTTEGAAVSVVDQGPVFVRVRVAHAVGRSSFTQDVVVYGALPRIDIPTTVNWQAEHQLLKIRLPVNADQPEMTGQIPFGSMVRPANGQECPGQKWMDVSQTVPAAVKAAIPLDLSPLFNARASENLDGSGNAYPADLLPAAGLHPLGINQVPFNLPAFSSNGFDHVLTAGQQLKLPGHAGGDTLYLLAASVNGGHGTECGFQLADGRTEFRAFNLNDWVVNAYGDNAAGFTFASRHTPGGRDTFPANMWIVNIPIPPGAAGLILPRDPRFHLFAATIASQPAAAEPCGLSVLNDAKYGFDMTNQVFRLTALRSPDYPDPHPDQGVQTFTYSLYPHAGGWREAHTENQALALNIPLLALVTTPHPPAGRIPTISVKSTGGPGDLVVTALKRSETAQGFVLRFYEADGQDTRAQVDLDEPVRMAATDLLEQPLAIQTLKVRGHSATLPVGHNQIISLQLEADSGK